MSNNTRQVTTAETVELAAKLVEEDVPRVGREQAKRWVNQYGPNRVDQVRRYFVEQREQLEIDDPNKWVSAALRKGWDIPDLDQLPTTNADYRASLVAAWPVISGGGVTPDEAMQRITGLFGRESSQCRRQPDMLESDDEGLLSRPRPMAPEQRLLLRACHWCFIIRDRIPADQHGAALAAIVGDGDEMQLRRWCLEVIRHVLEHQSLGDAAHWIIQLVDWENSERDPDGVKADIVRKMLSGVREELKNHDDYQLTRLYRLAFELDEAPC